jgi:hypothetical protein
LWDHGGDGDGSGNGGAGRNVGRWRRDDDAIEGLLQ